MQQCKIKLFYFSVNNKYSFRQAHFSDMKEIFRRIKFTGGGSYPVPQRRSWRGMLQPYYPKHRVPVQIPDGYPGTQIPESPSTI